MAREAGRRIVAGTARHLRAWPADLVAVGIAVVVVSTLSVAVYAGEATDADHVSIKAQGTEYLYSLNERHTEEYEGPLGSTVVQIADGSVWVEEDPGPLQICVKKGRISRAGEWLACLPNKVFIRIDGDTSPPGVDGHAF